MDKNESEVEHFGFSAERVSLERKLFIRKILNNAIDAVLNKIDCSKETLEHLVQQKENVFLSMLHSIDNEVRAADSLDTKNFMVPPHVLLPQYFDHTKAFPESDEKQIDLHLKSQRQKFLENSVMLASLKMENERYNRLNQLVEDEVHMQQLLKESFNNLDMNKVRTMVEKTRSYHD